MGVGVFRDMSVREYVGLCVLSDACVKDVVCVGVVTKQCVLVLSPNVSVREFVGVDVF